LRFAQSVGDKKGQRSACAGRTLGRPSGDAPRKNSSPSGDSHLLTGTCPYTR
jgi:hypothetical protein